MRFCCLFHCLQRKTVKLSDYRVPYISEIPKELTQFTSVSALGLKFRMTSKQSVKPSDATRNLNLDLVVPLTTAHGPLSGGAITTGVIHPRRPRGYLILRPGSVRSRGEEQWRDVTGISRVACGGLTMTITDRLRTTRRSASGAVQSK